MRGLRGASVLAALVTAAMLFASTATTAEDDFPIRFGGPFALIDHTGRSVTDEDFHGLFLLIFFGFTSCPDICPTTLLEITETLELLGERATAIQPVFVTVDPARDTPDVLADYLGHFHPQLLGLTGSEAQIAAVARAYKVHRRKVVLKDEADDRDYLVDHSSLAYLMGPEGEFVSLFPYNTASEFMAKAIERYIDQHEL